MKNKETILISGADGFLGANLFNILSKEYYVIGVEKEDHTVNRINIENLSQGCEIYSQSKLEWIFENKNIDFIIHTATNHAKKYNLYSEVFTVNVDFGIRLFQLAVQSNSKCFLNVDTILHKNTNLYSFTKGIFRDTLEYFSRGDLGIKVINIKMDMIYGPNAGDHNFIQYMLKKLLLNSAVINLTKGDQKRSFYYIDDLVKAFQLIIRNYSLLTEGFFTDLYLTNSKLHTIKEVMQYLKKTTESTSVLEFGSLPYREYEIMKTPIYDDLYQKLNWFPKYTLEDGLSKTIKNIKRKI
jgi:CDP-paratose synthetase